MTTIHLRAVKEADCFDLWAWRNDPETRRNSITTDDLPLEEHQRWFAASLKNSRRVMLLVERCGEKFGTVRFDRTASDEALWRVSIVINPLFRGKGIGRAALTASCREMERRYGPSAFAAEARISNVPSLRIFERCGFAPTSRSEGVVHLLRPRSTTDVSIA